MSPCLANSLATRTCAEIGCPIASATIACSASGAIWFLRIGFRRLMSSSAAWHPLHTAPSSGRSYRGYSP
jgi:hypothetical protein